MRYHGTSYCTSKNTATLATWSKQNGEKKVQRHLGMSREDIPQLTNTYNTKSNTDTVHLISNWHLSIQHPLMFMLYSILYYYYSKSYVHMHLY